jgi:hypothetical protein
MLLPSSASDPCCSLNDQRVKPLNSVESVVTAVQNLDWTRDFFDPIEVPGAARSIQPSSTKEIQNEYGN